MPIAGWGFAPAIAAGNAVVLKPAEITPLTAIRIGELGRRGRAPAGVFTVVPGKGSVVGQRFVTHPLVRKVCFTGSTEVGQADHGRLRRAGEAGDPRARRQERQHRLRRHGRGRGRGQRAVRRLRQRRAGLLRPLADPRRAHGVRRVRRAPRDGGPRAAGQGPVRRGQRDGADGLGRPARRPCSATSTATTVAFAGSAPDGPGWWLPPMVVESRDTAEPIWREEVFGPVVAVMPFDDEEHAIALANDSDYGLSGSIFTSRPRPRAAGRPRGRGREPERQLALERALLDAVRRLQAVRPRPGARPGRAVRVHRGEERLHRH